MLSSQTQSDTKVKKYGWYGGFREVIHVEISLFFKDILDPYVTPRIKLSKKGCFKSLNLAWWLGFKITDYWYWITEYHPFLAVFLRKS